MKKFATAIFVLFFVLLSTQLIRHAYTRITLNQKSVLDKYSKKPVDLQMDSSLSLKELALIYADAEKRIKLAESGKSKKALAKYGSDESLTSRKNKIENLISQRENDYRAITKIIFFWITALILAAAGSLVFIKLEIWIGASLITSGLTMMTWNTGPLFFMAAETPESSLVLTVKLLFTFITLAALTAYWHFTKRYHDTK